MAVEAAHQADPKLSKQTLGSEKGGSRVNTVALAWTLTIILLMFWMFPKLVPT
jgi:hypothetical protein